MDTLWTVALPGYATAAGTLALAAVTYLTLRFAVNDRRVETNRAARKNAARVQIEPLRFTNVDRSVLTAATVVTNHSDETAHSVEFLWLIGAKAPETKRVRIGTLVSGASAEVLLDLEATPSTIPTLGGVCQFSMTKRNWQVSVRDGQLVEFTQGGPAGRVKRPEFVGDS